MSELRRLAPVLTAAALLVLPACSGGDGEPSNVTTGVLVDRGRALLQRIALKATDLPEGITVGVIDGGSEVEGQVTLDLCGFDFQSEADRTDRLQTEAVDADSNRFLSNENVLYRDAAAARAALAEVRTAIVQCDPTHVVESDVLPPLRYELTPAPEAGLSGLTSDRVALTAVITDEAGERETYGVLYQRRGRVLVGVYGDAVTTMLPYARVVAQRLAALTPAEAGE